MAFNPVPTKSEYYFCRDLLAESKLNELEKESDDGLYYTTNMDITKSKLNSPDASGVASESLRNVLSPLFLHFSYTLTYNGAVIGKKDFRFLPTCLLDIFRDLQFGQDPIERSKLKITLNITCLTLPDQVQNISEDVTSTNLKMSVGIHPTITNSDWNPDSET